MLNLTQRREDAMDSGPAIRDSWGGSKQSVISGSVISKEPGARIQEPGDYAWGVSALRRSAAMMTQPKISSTYLITDYFNVSSINTRLGSSILLPRELCLPDSGTKSNPASLRREQEARAEVLDSWPTR